MFEITYKENAITDLTFTDEGACYDFTFENRYDIFHRPRKDKLEYVALDTATGLTSLIMEKKSPIAKDEYPLIIPKILFSIKYNGDQRYKGAGAYPPTDLIDIIFRVIMPQYGYAVREQQLEMAQSIYTGLSSKKATLCEAELEPAKPWLTWLLAS